MNTPNLDRFKPKPKDLIRTFWYPDNAETSEANGFRVTLAYTSPVTFGELEDKIRTRFTRDRSRTEAAPATVRNEVMNECLLHVVKKCEGVTFGKLQALCELDADAVRDAGGLDAPVPMDPSEGTNGELARLWLLKLLTDCTNFKNWVTQVSSTLVYFQDADWKERVKNSPAGGQAKKDGLTTSSEPASETSPATA